MAARIRVKDTDRGAKQRLRSLKTLKGGEVTVGIHASDGSKPEGTRTVLEVAIWNEFGTSRIPSRSFLRSWYDDHEKEAEARWKAIMRRVARGALSKEQGLNQFGLWVVGEIQKRISQGVPPPNDPKTIARKGSSVPLIDTGQLRSSITHRAKP